MQAGRKALGADRIVVRNQITRPAVSGKRFRGFRGFEHAVIGLPIAFKILPRWRQKLYCSGMTKLLEQAVETVRGLPPEIQDELARMLLQLAGEDQPLLQLSPEEEASLDESLAEADSGEFATDEQVRAIWAKRNL
jgi:hypothetical protein